MAYPTAIDFLPPFQEGTPIDREKVNDTFDGIQRIQTELGINCLTGNQGGVAGTPATVKARVDNGTRLLMASIESVKFSETWFQNTSNASAGVSVQHPEVAVWRTLYPEWIPALDPTEGSAPLGEFANPVIIAHVQPSQHETKSGCDQPIPDGQGNEIVDWICVLEQGYFISAMLPSGPKTKLEQKVEEGEIPYGTPFVTWMAGLPSNAGGKHKHHSTDWGSVNFVTVLTCDAP